MRSKAFTIAALLLVWAAAGVSPTYAQVPSPLVLNIPFEFVAGNQTLPAGAYRFEPLLSLTPGVNVLVVRSTDGRVYKAAVTSMAEAVESQPSSKLVFNRYGDQHVLSQIWVEGKPLGLQLRCSRETELAKNQAKREVVLLVPRPGDRATASAAPPVNQAP